MIQVSNLNKHFGTFKVLDKLNLHVKEGSIYGLLGPNGAGKTTLIKHISGIFRQDSGSVSVMGEPIFENPTVKSSMIYIPDDVYFFSQYSIEDTAEFYSNLYPNWNWERYERLKQVFPMNTKRRVTRLSKGMQKQVAFWLAISAMPKVMVLDEPVDGLDPVMRKKVWNLVLQDVSERKTTVLVSSHNLRELEDICDHVGILHQGQIMIERDLDSLKSDIHKVQVAFPGGSPGNLLPNDEILYRSQNGSVLLLIVKGNREKILSQIREAGPVILDVLPLTLEEIFIYELGGIGYDIQNIVI